MTSQIRVIIVVIFIVICNLCAFAQCNLPVIPQSSSKPRLARLFPSAIVDLPKDFSVLDSKGHIDAWGGSMASSDGEFQITFSGGMVESVFEKYKKELTCKEVIKGFEFPVTVGVVAVDKKEIMLAKVFWAQFVATITSNDEKALFLKIVTSYRREMSKPSK